eukprot:6729807-Prymnesium_polylepis.1
MTAAATVRRLIWARGGRLSVVAGWSAVTSLPLWWPWPTCFRSGFFVMTVVASTPQLSKIRWLPRRQL